MKDIEKLLRMTERPQDYSDEELEQLLSDPEMRDYYELMVNAEAGFAQEDHAPSSAALHNRRTVPMIFRIAAVFIGVLLLSGMAYAAYRYVAGGESSDGEDVEAPTHEVRLADDPRQEADVVRIFEDVELQQILQELSDHYHVGVEFRNEQSRHIRFYTKWDTTAPLKQIIERLNGFEKVSIQLTNNQIIAE